MPSTTQVALIATETKTPMIALSPVALPPDKLEWIFVVPQPAAHDERGRRPHEGARRQDRRLHRLLRLLGRPGLEGDPSSTPTPAGSRSSTNERYARADTSVTGQVLKIIAANPDAVVVGGSGTGGALPHIALVERGYKGPIYHNHGTVNREFIKVGGKASKARSRRPAR